MSSRSEDKLLTPMELRKRVGLSQRKVAEALDIKAGTVSAWETGKTIPNLTPSKFQKMLAVYQCSIDELVEAFEGSTQNKSAKA